MTKQGPRDRLREAAFSLFEERGYEQTTVDDITERAGLGRTTFFRNFRSKEDVIFPDHDRLLEPQEEQRHHAGHDHDHREILEESNAVHLHGG